MPGQNIIELGYDVETLSAQQKIVVEYLGKTLELADQLDRRKIAPDITGQKDLNESLTKQKKVIDEVTLATNEYNKLLTATATTQAKSSAASSTAAENLAIEKEQLKQRNTELQNAAKYLLSEANSIEEAKNKIKLLTAERDKLNLSTQEGRDKQLQFNNEINKNNEFIKANVSLLEQQKINIGNYAGSFKGAFSVLSNDLAKIREQLKNMKPGDAGFDKLTKDEQVLNQITETLSQSFSSTKQELKTLTEAAKQMGLNFGLADERFQNFVKEVGEAKDELGDIQNTINFEASDTKYLDGIVSAINGIAGAYGAAEAATQLFGDDTKELEKSMQKLQAIIALVTSLQAIQNAVQTDGAAIQTALAIRIAFLNTVQSVSAQINTLLTAQTEIQTVAVAEQAVATEAATVAAGEQAIANEAMAATAATATTATSTLSTVLAASGIGLAILAIGSAVVYLTSKIPDWISGNKLSEEQLKNLTDAQKKFNQILVDQANIIQSNDQATKNFYQKQLDLASASGQSQEKQFAIKKKLAIEENRLAQDQINILGASNRAYAQNESAVQSLQNKLIEANEGYSKSVLDKNKTDEEAFKTLIDRYNSQLSAIMPIYDAQKKAREDLFNSNKQIAVNEAAEAKFNADEARKLALETAKLEAEAVQTKNNLILGDERSTQAQRIAAMRSNVEEQKKIAKAERDAVLNDPSASKNDKLLAQKRFNSETYKLNSEEKEAERKLNLEYRNRELAANKVFAETIATEIIAANDRIATSNAFSLEERIQALNKSVEEQKKVIDADYQYQIKTKVLTDKEREALDAQHNAKLIELKLTTENRLITIQQSSFEQQKADIDRFYKYAEKTAELANAEQTLKTQRLYAEQVKALNDSFLSGKISIEKYNRDRKKLDDSLGIELLNDLQTNLQNQLAIQKGYLNASESAIVDYNQRIAALENKKNRSTAEQEELDALKKKLQAEESARKDHQIKIDNINEQSSKNSIQLTEKEVTKKAEARLKERELVKQLISESLNLLQTLVDSGYQKELEALQQLKNASDEKYGTEIKNIQNSTLSEQDKAAKTAQLTAEQNARDKKLEREQREVKNRQAKADRLFAVANIIASGAQAEVQALTYLSNPITAALYPGIAALIATVVGVQLASVLSKPIPQYASGTDNHPGGPAIVGEGKHKELVTTPSGSSFIADKPMLIDLPLGTTVQPLTSDDINMVMNYSMIKKTSEIAALGSYLDSKRRNEAWEVAKWQTEEMKKALRHETKNIINTNVSIDYGFTEYINKQVFGK